MWINVENNIYSGFFFLSVNFSLYSANIMFLKHELCIKWMLYCSQVKIS